MFEHSPETAAEKRRLVHRIETLVDENISWSHRYRQLMDEQRRYFLTKGFWGVVSVCIVINVIRKQKAADRCKLGGVNTHGGGNCQEQGPLGSCVFYNS